MIHQRGHRIISAAVISVALIAAGCSSDREPFGQPTSETDVGDGADIGSETTTTIAVEVDDPPATEPAATDPTATEPASTEPASTEPASTEPPSSGPPSGPPAAAAGPGQACVGSREGVSCLQDDGSWVVHDESTGLSNDFVTALDVCNGGEVVVANSSGLEMFDGTRWLELVEPFEFGGADHLQCVTPDDIWAGGFDEAAHWDGSGWELFAPEVFGEGILEDLELGPDGQPWFGSTEGIFGYDGTAWTVYDESNSFENHSVDDLSFAPNGRLEAVLLLSRATFDGGAWVESDYDGTAKAIAATDDAVLIGTFSRGVDLITGGTTATLDRSTGEMPTDKIESMTVDASGRVWVGTQYGLVVLQDGAVVQTFQMNNSAMHDDLIRNVSVQGSGPTSLDGLSSSPVSTFSGVITDGTSPVEGAQVEICVLPLLDSFDGPTPCADQPISYTATTGADGSFSMSDVVRGRYVFVVNAGPGWIQATGQFGISSERVLIDADLDIGDFAAVAEE